MARQRDIDPSFYAAADRFVNDCLRQQGSLFSPGRSIWTADDVAELYSRVVENPDFGEADFSPKLTGQLAGAADEVVLFSAELLYVLLLTQHQGAQSKVDTLDPVLRAGSAPVIIPSDLLDALSHGIASYGAALAHRYWQYVLLLEFVRAWTKLSMGEHTELLANPHRFHDFVRELPDKGASSQVEALLYLVFPDTFEPIVSVPTQDKIIQTFSQFSGDTSIPRYKRLALIREALTPEYGSDFSLYQPDIKRLWSGKEAKPPQRPIHLVVKWSAHYGENTVDDHRDVDESKGAVWWGLIGSAEKPKIATKWFDAMRQQLDAGVDTYIFISGPSCWRTTLLDIATSRDEVEANLIPSYYPSELDHNLWVKIHGFEAIDRAWLTEHLELVSARGKPLSAGALSNQTNPLIVHVSGAPAVAGQPRVWWVCQGQTYSSGRDHTVMWAPKQARDGAERPYWRALTDARVGDSVLHYANGSVRGTSVIADEAVDALAPESSPDGWMGQDGWLVRTAYDELETPLPLEEIPVEWRTGEGGAFTRQGAVQQGYFYTLSPEFASKLAARFPQLKLPVKYAAVDGASDYVEPDFPSIFTQITDAGLRLDEQTVRRYHLSLRTRGFVVLSGLSGSGKTWLAQLYARAVDAKMLLVSVAPNWTTNEDLLGYYDPLAKQYRHTSFSRFLEAAADEWKAAKQSGRTSRPFHLVLDEMNLARVEYYFAKFLSAMEVRAREGSAILQLDTDREALLTPNLYFAGTVNVDETTHGFADKVYDRAQLLEVRVARDGIVEHLEDRPYASELIAVWDAMQVAAPFAYRVLDEISSYVDAAGALSVPWEVALDEQLLQKVLPKIKGTEKAIGPALERFVELADGTWPLSRAKASEMHDAFVNHGFTSYF
jgi:hypothetical protein